MFLLLGLLLGFLFGRNLSSFFLFLLFEDPWQVAKQVKLLFQQLLHLRHLILLEATAINLLSKQESQAARKSQ